MVLLLIPVALAACCLPRQDCWVEPVLVRACCHAAAGAAAVAAGGPSGPWTLLPPCKKMHKKGAIEVFDRWTGEYVIVCSTPGDPGWLHGKLPQCG